MTSSSHDYTMSRVKLKFPAKAYPSQVQMMNQIIRALQKGQNALLESPTGSGKSLALLCAALAWQQEEAKRAKEYNEAIESGLMEPEMILVDENDEEITDPRVLERVRQEASEPGAGGGFLPQVDNDDDDFVSTSPPRKKVRTEDEERTAPKPPAPKMPLATTRRAKRKVVPKIFFGTRTHKQISQIIRELNKTVYKDSLKMTILGSREHTCIHPTVSKLKNKNEGCKEQNDSSKGMSCSYRQNGKQRLSTHEALGSYRGTATAWDLEDLVKVGKKVKSCPYYASRDLKMKAQIIFCPYNYLVEPMIRKSMEINLKGQIVILDEAHNIEDSARSAASWSVTQEELREAMQDCEKLMQTQSAPEAHREMALLLSNLCQWIDGSSSNLGDYSDFNSASKVWTGTEIIAVFNIYNIGTKRHNEIKEQFAVVMTEWKDQSEANRENANDGMTGEDSVPLLHSNTIATLEGYFTTMDFLYRDDMKYRDDYRVAVTRTQSRNKPARPIGGNGNRWLNKNQTQQKQDVHKFTFTANFWCLNPAVAFDDIKDEIHSIVLTSGTLSPMTSFSSELDVKFPQQLEANHVIDKKQVWISTLSHGPNRQNLNATYRNTETYAFQDEIGRLTLSVCRTIAHGVLLFLPSYAMLNKLTERWRQTGLYNDLNSKKVVIPEPRFSDEFESSIKHFYDVISATEKGANDSGVDGALFIAVCRGKVSEGLDFADNNARAVICVGIPYPNVRDVQVDLKKKYNDKRKIDNRNILSGNEWYEIQAFRALNQALGRCIRHKRDWGAILMVDDRYQKSPKYIASLSKWVRAGIVHYSSCDMMTESLKQFSEDMVQMDADHKAQIQEKEIEEDLKNESEPRKDPTRMAIERLERIRNEAKAAAPIFGVGKGKKVIEETERKEEEAMKSLLEDERKRNRPTQMLSHFARSMAAVDNLPPLGSFGDRIPITKPKEAPQVKQAEMNTKERGQKGVIESISSALPVSLKPSTLGNVNLNSGISGSVTMPVQSFENAPSSSSRVNKPGSILSHFKRGNQASETKVINLEDEEDADDPKEMSGSSEKENGDIPAASVPLSTVVPDSSSDDDLTEDGQIIGKGKVGGRQPDADVSEEEDLDELGQRVVGKTSPGFSFKPILASSSSIAHEDKSTPGCDGEEHLPSSSSGYTPALSQRAKLNLARKNGKKKGLVVLKKAKPPVTYIGDSDDDFI